mmetsp:Transcript_66890/g.192303  ORF Transcript_66890/g.192303 Transcript_66890/m.192303 type:complete len:227 (-) Transcript_66890:610-1290(-)
MSPRPCGWQGTCRPCPRTGVGPSRARWPCRRCPTRPAHPNVRHRDHLCPCPRATCRRRLLRCMRRRGCRGPSRSRPRARGAPPRSHRACASPAGPSRRPCQSSCCQRPIRRRPSCPCLRPWHHRPWRHRPCRPTGPSFRRLCRPPCRPWLLSRSWHRPWPSPCPSPWPCHWPCHWPSARPFSSGWFRRDSASGACGDLRVGPACPRRLLRRFSPRPFSLSCCPCPP